MFIIAITCITTIIIEYSNYSRNISNIAQTEAQKAKEKLLIQTNYENQTITINIKNEGSTPSTIVSILTLNPTTNTLTHYNLNQPLTCTILGETTIHLNQTIPQNHQIATLTSLGNTFWNHKHVLA